MASSTSERAGATSGRDAATADLDLLAGWIGDETLAGFEQRHLRRAPLARPGTVADAARRFLDWPRLGRVLAADHPPADVLVVARGKLLSLPPPRSGAQLRPLLDAGA